MLLCFRPRLGAEDGPGLFPPGAMLLSVVRAIPLAGCAVGARLAGATDHQQGGQGQGS